MGFPAYVCILQKSIKEMEIYQNKLVLHMKLQIE